jgi:cell division septal protein FtsQ
MSKRKRQYRGRASPRSRKRSSRAWTSLAIPIAVGLVVLVIIVGAIMSIENRQPAAASLPGDGPVSGDTAQPLLTQSIPNPNVPRITLDEAQDMLGQGLAVLVDVRSRSSYDKLHATGAVSLPEEEVDARFDELPRDKDWILY